ncbi:MAG: ferritin-like domain-containing protein [Planctomycetes bacterium]|jgi:ferritin-like metal-binding protein YciE|nr:ferritin-like domain-containing protein [Planctomycetota bacterium]
MGLIARIKAAGKSLDNMQDLLLEELNELYDVEDQIIKALPKMREAASSPVLKQAFDKHLEQTQRQKERLEQIFRELGRQPERVGAEGMKGIISEGQMIISMDGDPHVKDAALIAAAQRVEHYEMASYGSARTYARELGHQRVADLLQTTLDEEGSTDKELSQVAISQVNPRASQS